MPRLFTAIKIEDEIGTALALKQYGLEGARWIAREDFHITLSFIGDVELAQKTEIEAVLENMPPRAPFFVSLGGSATGGLEAFGTKRPRALFAPIKENEELNRLKYAQERELRTLGIGFETRKFIPHVTIARLGGGRRGGVRANNVAQYLSRNIIFEPLVFEVKSFCLYSARSSVGGGPYVVEREYELRND